MYPPNLCERKTLYLSNRHSSKNIRCPHNKNMQKTFSSGIIQTKSAEAIDMSAKDFLQQAFVAHKEIEVRLEQITRLQSLATQTTNALRHAPGGNNIFRSRVENVVIRIQELTELLADEIARLIEVTKRISSAIAQVPNANERAILEYRYLCFFSWPQIAAVTKTSITTVFRLHRSALKNFRVVEVNGSK